MILKQYHEINTTRYSLFSNTAETNTRKRMEGKKIKWFAEIKYYCQMETFQCLFSEFYTQTVKYLYLKV